MKPGDRVERRFPSCEPRQGTVTRVNGEEIVVMWDHMGIGQVLPLDQQTYVRRIK